MLSHHTAPVAQADTLHQRRRQALIAHRRLRSLALGPCMWLQFEDALTVQHLIDEVLLAHRDDTPEACRREVDTCTHLLPDGRQWKATLLIGLPDSERRARGLAQLHEAAHRLYVQLPRMPRVYARPNDAGPGRTHQPSSAVHALRFDFPPPLRVALLAGSPASLGCAHDDYAYRRVIPMAALEQLRCDLALHTR